MTAERAEQTTDWLSEPGVQRALAEGEARAAFNAERLAAAIYAFSQAADEVNRAALGSEVLCWQDAATLLDALREARQTAQAVEANMEVRAAKAMANAGLKQEELDGVGVVEWRRGSSSRSWQHDALARDVLAAHMAEVGGEVTDPHTVRDWLLEAAHVDYWRATVLRELGLDPEDYAERKPGKLSVQITHPG